MPYNGNMDRLEAHLILEALEKMRMALEAMEERMAEIFAATVRYNNDDYDL